MEGSGGDTVTILILHQFETQELTYLLVCCGAHKGKRALSSTGTRTHAYLMAEAAQSSNCVFLAGSWI
jgi:hypothetical protein